MVKRIAWSVAFGILTLAVTLLWRGFPLRLALLSGVAVGILLYSTSEAIGRVAALYRKS